MWRILLLMTMFPFTLAYIDPANEVLGVPSIQCGEETIVFSVRTRNPFRGYIFVKGHYGNVNCRQEFYSNDLAGASFAVRIGDCGMQRLRQLQPLGMNFLLTITTAFHPQFVTRDDRSYAVRCFYAHADKTVNAEMSVGPLSTMSLEQATVLMPACEYSIRVGSVDGPIATSAQIGERLFHRWECDNPNYGMIVKNCFVNNGEGVSTRVVDGRGCPIYSNLVQGGITYDASLTVAYVPVWAYKFPDADRVYFQCQIQACSKRDDQCIGITPPNCPSIVAPDFLPNSIINSDVDPTQVIASFESPLGPHETNSMNGIPPLSAFPYKDDAPIESDEKSDEKTAHKTSTTSSLPDDLPLDDGRNYTRSHPVIILEKKTTTRAARATVATPKSTPSSTPSPSPPHAEASRWSSRLSDLPLDVIDVAAPPVLISDPAEIAPNRPAARMLNPLDDRTCLARETAWSLLALLLATATMSLGFLVILFRDCYARCFSSPKAYPYHAEFPRVSHSPTSSSVSVHSDDTVSTCQDLPASAAAAHREMYAHRHLGNPTYVVPLRR